MDVTASQQCRGHHSLMLVAASKTLHCHSIFECQDNMDLTATLTSQMSQHLKHGSVTGFTVLQALQCHGHLYIKDVTQQSGRHRHCSITDVTASSYRHRSITNIITISQQAFHYFLEGVFFLTSRLAVDVDH